jgi:hypothetical protein
MKIIAVLFLLAGALLVETGCSSSVTADLDVIVTTASAIVDIAFPQYAAVLNPYFSQVTTFIDQVTAELATTDTTGQKAAVIAADAALIAAPNLSGLPAEVAQRVAAIAPLISNLVAEIRSLSSAAAVYPGGANAFFAAHRFRPPSASELAKIRAKNAALKARLVSPKKK